MIGKKFNKLTVIAQAGSNKHGARQYLCKCDCGKERIVSKYKIINKIAKACSDCRYKTVSEKTKKYKIGDKIHGFEIISLSGSPTYWLELGCPNCFKLFKIKSSQTKQISSVCRFCKFNTSQNYHLEKI